MSTRTSPQATSGAKVKVVPHGDRAILITRSFNAPRKLVFDAMSRPEMMKQWFHGPPGWTLTTCTMDLRAGGSYRWAWTNEKGHEMGMGGTYIEVVAPERYAATEKFDQAWYPGEARATTTLTEQGGRTTVTTRVLYESKEARDVVLKSPMEEGVEAGYDRLAEFLAGLAKQ